MCEAPTLPSPDLNGSGEPVDVGRDPSFSSYLCPAAVVAVDLVLTTLLHALRHRGAKNNNQKDRSNMRLCFFSLSDAECPWNPTFWYHEASVADVPCESGHGLFLRVHNRVLNDVCRAGHLLWKVRLHPARRSARFGQQSSGFEAVGWSNLPENDVLSQNMVAVGAVRAMD